MNCIWVNFKNWKAVFDSISHSSVPMFGNYPWLICGRFCLGGGRGVQKWRGWLNGDKNRNPLKSLELSTPTKIPGPKITPLRNPMLQQAACNTLAWLNIKIKAIIVEYVWLYFIWIPFSPQKKYSNQATFLPPTTTKKKTKILHLSLLLEIWITPWRFC